ncbi:MAG TPA: universal stress protein [Thermoanaerobaculaceae bacterium]|nr:universal stress protein [Thermoanaerobaculaceae bacterium]
MFRRILLAYDGSEGARIALERVRELATPAAEVHVLAVGRIPEYAETVSEVEEAKEQAARHYRGGVDDAVQSLRAAGVTAEPHVDYGKVGDTIVRVAEAVGADLIVVGTNPHTALKRRVLGASADKVVDHAHCSVLVVRGAAPAASRPAG